MGTLWKPPIPKGAFVEAQSLGAGLVLLGYCYDIVKGGGLIEINLHELYPLLGTSYASVRRWWGMMQKMGVIERVEERGRSGVRAYFNPDWIDWRQTETRSPISANRETSSPVSTNGKEMRSEMRSETSSPVSANHNVYGTQDSDQAESVREREDRERTAHALAHPAMKTLVEFSNVQLDAKQIRSVCSTATDGKVWRSVVELFADNNWLPLIGNMLDRYRKMLKEKASEKPGYSIGRPTPPTIAQPRNHAPTDTALLAQLRAKAREK